MNNKNDDGNERKKLREEIKSLEEQKKKLKERELELSLFEHSIKEKELDITFNIFINFKQEILNSNQNIIIHEREIRDYLKLSFDRFIKYINNDNRYTVGFIEHPSGGNRHCGGPDEPSEGYVVVTKNY